MTEKKNPQGCWLWPKMALLLVFSWHEIGFVWVSFGEPAGKFSRSFVRKGGAPCIMVLAREVWNCVHKLNYFNLREREWEWENNGERLCEGECCIYMWTYACVLMEREKEGDSFLFFYGAHIYKWEYKPSCRRLQTRPNVTLQLEAMVDIKKQPPSPKQQLPDWQRD